MKKGVVYVLIITIVFSLGFIQKNEYAEEIYQIEEILNERTIIINDFLYTKVDKSKLCEELSTLGIDKKMYSNMKQLLNIYVMPDNYKVTQPTSTPDYQRKDFLTLYNKLSKVEIDEKLDFDMKLLIKINKNPTDFEKVGDCKITKCNVIKSDDKEFEANVTVSFATFAENDFVVENSIIKEYNILCIIKDNRYYLARLDDIK